MTDNYVLFCLMYTITKAAEAGCINWQDVIENRDDLRLLLGGDEVAWKVGEDEYAISLDGFKSSADRIIGYVIRRDSE